MKLDPRYYQIAMLSGLLVYGMAVLEFDITVFRAVLQIATVLIAQYACTKLWKLPKFDPLSPLISGLSLCLLLRTNYELVAVGLAAFSIVSKFVIRWNGKHIFNPTNGAIVLGMLTGYAWVSPGQWGSAAWLAFLFACVGMLVVHRAERQDVTYAALVFWCLIVFGRSFHLAEPLTIPVHRLQSGAFLLWAFFMISDPKTTPDSRAGRILFAALVALAAGYWQFRMFETNGLLWWLAFFSMLTPLIDAILPGDKYEWRGSSPLATT